MKRAFLVVPMALLVGYATGCGGPSPEVYRAAQDATYAKKLAESLEEKLEASKKTMESLELRLAIVELSKSEGKAAYLRPGSDGYQIIRTDIGNVTVMMDDVKAYANGSRVRLRFGNTTNATLADIKATLGWGSTNEMGYANDKGQKSKSITFSKELLPGSWTHVDVVLDSFPPQLLGFVRVTDLEIASMRMAIAR